MRYLLLTLILAQPAAALPIANGSFEEPALTATQNLAGPFSFTGWSGQGPSDGGNAGLVLGPDNGLNPADGTQHFNFNGGNPSDRGWLEQTLTTTPGSTYDLTFALGRAGGGQELSLAATTWPQGPEPVEGLTHTFLPPPAPGYQLHHHTFSATSPITLLRFTDTSGPNSISDLYLDAISITQRSHAAPVSDAGPGPELLALLGAALLACRRRSSSYGGPGPQS